ncbi:MAG: hypothetical protein SGI71_05185 [Verrucomicrobiota bacterium]|nr:hypothetical protein [Verrucomicrobiota bacterium]
MPLEVSRNSWPLWIRLTLWKVPFRFLAWTYLWACLLFGVLIFSIGAWFAAPIMLVAAAGYWKAIKWVDARDGWKKLAFSTQSTSLEALPVHH